MAQSYSTVGTFLVARKQIGDRRSDNVAATQHHTMLALGFNVVMLKYRAHSHRGSRQESVLAKHHTTDIDRCESINILIRRNGVYHLLLVDLLGQRQLDDKSVDIIVIVKEINGFKQFLFRRVGRIAVD